MKRIWVGFFILTFLSVILREIRGQNFLNLMGALAVMDELAGLNSVTTDEEDLDHISWRCV
jgi:hypothetical protein